VARGVAPDSDERSTVVDVDIVVDDEVKVRMRKALVPARVQPWLQASVALPVLSGTPGISARASRGHGVALSRGSE